MKLESTHHRSRRSSAAFPTLGRAGAAAALLLALATACNASGDARGATAGDSATTRAASHDSAASGTAAALAPTPLGAAPTIRALYVNRFAAQSTKKMKHLIAVADSTEINALVIDMKDEFGLNYNSANAEFNKNGGNMTKVQNVRALVDTLKAHDILPIARIVVFKDSVTARVNPQWTIRQNDGSIWRDHKGLAWVNPYHRELWDYNIGVAEELVKMGFGEVQFDYIRFPEPYKSLPPQVFPDAGNRQKPETLAEFLRTARGRLSKLGVRTTADIFGLVTTVRGPLEVGQEWEKVAPVTDVLLPMTYPSHYPPGSFGIPRPNAAPYKTINLAIAKAHERDDKLGISGEHVRPWLQAFTLGAPKYGAEEMRQQKQAVYDAGYDGWVWWSPGSNYDIFLPALEKTLVSRKKPWKAAAAAAAAATAASAPAPNESIAAARLDSAKKPVKP